VELRLDYFEQVDLAELNQLQKLFPIPMIFTLRDRTQGGNFSGTESKRQEILYQLASLKPAYLDLESHLPRTFVENISRKYPDTQRICSYHDFTKTPEDLDTIHQEMMQRDASLYKLAVTPQNPLDAMRLLLWAKGKKLITVGMGMHGQASRILGPIVGSPITYAALDESQTTAPGQLTAQKLKDCYRFSRLKPDTAIYGLIGDPVDQSVSHDTHNHLMAILGWNAVYVKIAVKSEELRSFLQLAKELPFRGLSVTMPLKEHVLSFLDEIDPQALVIGAVNTLLFERGRIKGFNTDGSGALNALEAIEPVCGKKIVLLGAGGASRAIAFEALRRGAEVTILNRNAAKAEALAHHLHCQWGSLDRLPSIPYDILINCTPSPMPCAPSDILSNRIAMDIKTKPKDTLFLQHALIKECQLVYGYQMFVEQAVGQFALWFPQADSHAIRKILFDRISIIIN
jgi:3-dehydroquinate dehydratase/shikimate dehydrogenase